MLMCCLSCAKADSCEQADRVEDYCIDHEERPMTNADRIRQMSDEELAIEETSKGGCPHDCETPDDMDTDCVRCWLDWLKKEVDDGNT